jgi:hypothetical protein
MNIGKLSFNRIYRLQSPANLIRVQQARYRALCRAWERVFGTTPPHESQMRVVFPLVVNRFDLAFDAIAEARIKLRKAADNTLVCPTPGCWTEFRVIDPRFYGVDKYACKLAVRRALCIMDFCESHNVPSRLAWADNGRVAVEIETDEDGALALTYKTGPHFNRTFRACKESELDPYEIFWWVPRGYNGTLNPSNQPVNTPNIDEVVSTILW